MEITLPYKKTRLLPIYFSLFMSFCGWGIILPIIPVLFIEPKTALLPMDATIHMRTFLFGLYLAAYPIAGFIFGPFLSWLSDIYGRKKILILIESVAIFTWALSAIAVIEKDIVWLFVSRFLTGAFGGTTSVGKAVIADISTDETRLKNFSRIAVLYSLGLIIGPLLGGELSNQKIAKWLTIDIPFWTLSLMSVINVSLLFTFEETFKQSKIVKLSSKMLRGFKHILGIFESKRLIKLFTWIFIYRFGWVLYLQTFQVFLFEKFGLSHDQIGILYAYMGVWGILVQYLIAAPLGKIINSSTILKYFIPILVPMIGILALPTHMLYIYLLIPLSIIFEGVIQTNISCEISTTTTSEHQGEIQGQNAAIGTLATIVSALIGGTLIAYHPPLPITLGSLCILISWPLYLKYLKFKDSELAKN